MCDNMEGNFKMKDEQRFGYIVSLPYSTPTPPPPPPRESSQRPSDR